LLTVWHHVITVSRCSIIWWSRSRWRSKIVWWQQTGRHRWLVTIALPGSLSWVPRLHHFPRDWERGKGHWYMSSVCGRIWAQRTEWRSIINVKHSRWILSTSLEVEEVVRRSSIPLARRFRGIMCRELGYLTVFKTVLDDEDLGKVPSLSCWWRSWPPSRKEFKDGICFHMPEAMARTKPNLDFATNIHRKMNALSAAKAWAPALWLGGGGGRSAFVMVFASIHYLLLVETLNQQDLGYFGDASALARVALSKQIFAAAWPNWSLGGDEIWEIVV